jgi:hypothetical protein
MVPPTSPMATESLPSIPRKNRKHTHGDDDGDEAEQQVLRVAEVRRVRIADHEFAGDLDEVDADDDDHDPDDQRREELEHLDEQRHREDVEDTREQHGADRGLDIGALCDRDEQDRRRPAGKHDERQPHADLPHAHRLQDRPETGEDEDRRQHRRGGPAHPAPVRWR